MNAPLHAQSGIAVKMPARSPERWTRYGICLLVFYAAARAVVASISRPLWYDEIYTWVIARQPNLAAMWGALRRGVDPQPPLFHLIERVGALFPSAEVGLRLPSVVGFACVMVCLFVFVRRLNGGIYGLISAGMAMLTILYIPYAIEARPYSMVTAAVAVALVAYQRASSPAWAGLMALALAAAVSLHYYAIFAIIPFAAAEAVFCWQTSKIRGSVWVALMVGASPLAVFWQLLAHFKAIMGANFWARPDVLALRDVYGRFLNVSSYWGLAASIVCGLAVLGGLSVMDSHVPDPSETANGFADNDLRERVLTFSLLATPVIVFFVARLSHGAYLERYVLYAVLGIPLAIGFVLPRLGRPALVLVSVLLVCAIAMQEASFWFAPRQSLWRLQPPAAAPERMLRNAGYSDLPVFIADSHQYLQAAYYASQTLAARLVWVADAPAALRYGKADSSEKALPLLATCYPLKVYDSQAFRSACPSFLLYSTASGFEDWWPDRLVHDGYRLRVLAAEQDQLVFLATPPEAKNP